MLDYNGGFPVQQSGSWSRRLVRCKAGNKHLCPVNLFRDNVLDPVITRTSRPARPARCIADDFVISLVKRVSKPAETVELGCE